MGACMNSKESKKNPVAAFFGAIGKFFKEFGEAAAKGGRCSESIAARSGCRLLEKKTNQNLITDYSLILSTVKLHSQRRQNIVQPLYNGHQNQCV